MTLPGTKEAHRGVYGVVESADSVVTVEVETCPSHRRRRPLAIACHLRNHVGRHLLAADQSVRSGSGFLQSGDSR
jgi:hypothetical protein